VDGIESNFAVNVEMPFLLTHLLMDSLKALDQSARQKIWKVVGKVSGAE
jgi:hypothetical protein